MQKSMIMSDFPDHWRIPKRSSMEGAYCRLEPLDPDRHGDHLFEAVTGPEAERLHRYLPDTVPRTRREFEGWLTSRAASSDPLYFVVVDKATGRVEGRQTLMDINTTYGSAEIGHILWGPRIAGSRITTEAFYLFADHIFSLGYRRYQWRCNALNEPSRRAALRFGYQFEGIFRHHMIVKGANRDTAWYSILDTEWPRLKTGFEAWLQADNFDKLGGQLCKLTF
jgi:RimJ/RimL family protein N-acetyltransferase